MVVEWEGWDDKKRERGGGRLNDSEGSLFRFKVSREISQ